MEATAVKKVSLQDRLPTLEDSAIDKKIKTIRKKLKKPELQNKTKTLKSNLKILKKERDDRFFRNIPKFSDLEIEQHLGRLSQEKAKNAGKPREEIIDGMMERLRKEKVARQEKQRLESEAAIKERMEQGRRLRLNLNRDGNDPLTDAKLMAIRILNQPIPADINKAEEQHILQLEKELGALLKEIDHPETTKQRQIELLRGAIAKVSSELAECKARLPGIQPIPRRYVCPDVEEISRLETRADELLDQITALEENGQKPPLDLLLEDLLLDCQMKTLRAKQKCTTASPFIIQECEEKIKNIDLVRQFNAKRDAYLAKLEELEAAQNKGPLDIARIQAIKILLQCSLEVSDIGKPEVEALFAFEKDLSLLLNEMDAAPENEKMNLFKERIIALSNQLRTVILAIHLDTPAIPNPYPPVDPAQLLGELETESLDMAKLTVLILDYQDQINRLNQVIEGNNAGIMDLPPEIRPVILKETEDNTKRKNELTTELKREEGELRVRSLRHQITELHLNKVRLMQGEQTPQTPFLIDEVEKQINNLHRVLGIYEQLQQENQNARLAQLKAELESINAELPHHLKCDELLAQIITLQSELSRKALIPILKTLDFCDAPLKKPEMITDLSISAMHSALPPSLYEVRDLCLSKQIGPLELKELINKADEHRKKVRKTIIQLKEGPARTALTKYLEFLSGIYIPSLEQNAQKYETLSNGNVPVVVDIHAIARAELQHEKELQELLNENLEPSPQERVPASPASLRSERGLSPIEAHQLEFEQSRNRQQIERARAEELDHLEDDGVEPQLQAVQAQHHLLISPEEVQTECEQIRKEIREIARSKSQQLNLKHYQTMAKDIERRMQQLIAKARKNRESHKALLDQIPEFVATLTQLQKGLESIRAKEVEEYEKAGSASAGLMKLGNWAQRQLNKVAPDVFDPHDPIKQRAKELEKILIDCINQISSSDASMQPQSPMNAREEAAIERQLQAAPAPVAPAEPVRDKSHKERIANHRHAVQGMRAGRVEKREKERYLDEQEEKQAALRQADRAKSADGGLLGWLND